MLENPEELNPWPAFIGLIIINLIIILLSFSDPRKQTLLLRLFQNLGACEIRVGMYGVYLNKIHVFCYVTGETVVTLSSGEQNKGGRWSTETFTTHTYFQQVLPMFTWWKKSSPRSYVNSPVSETACSSVHFRHKQEQSCRGNIYCSDNFCQL